ncbi:hypothetical protein J6590_017432, partial [Homalodisca vitripennis]
MMRRKCSSTSTAARELCRWVVPRWARAMCRRPRRPVTSLVDIVAVNLHCLPESLASYLSIVSRLGLGDVPPASPPGHESRGYRRHQPPLPPPSLWLFTYPSCHDWAWVMCRRPHRLVTSLVEIVAVNLHCLPESLASYLSIVLRLDLGHVPPASPPDHESRGYRSQPPLPSRVFGFLLIHRFLGSPQRFAQARLDVRQVAKTNTRKVKVPTQKPSFRIVLKLQWIVNKWKPVLNKQHSGDMGAVLTEVALISGRPHSAVPDKLGDRTRLEFVSVLVISSGQEFGYFGVLGINFHQH